MATNVWGRILNNMRNKRKDYFKGTQGSKLISKNAWDVSKDLQKSIQDQETFIEAPTTNRWIGKGGVESITPERGKRRVQMPSTAIKDVMYDPNSTTASVMFVDGDKYYDYKVSPTEMKDFLNAPSKGHHVSTLWNHNPHFNIFNN